MRTQYLFDKLHSCALWAWRRTLAPSGGPVILWLPERNGDGAPPEDDLVADFLFYFRNTGVILEYFIPDGDGFDRHRIDGSGRREAPEFRKRRPSLRESYCRYDALLQPREWNFKGRTLLFPHLEYTDHWLNLVWPRLLERLMVARVDWKGKTSATLQKNVENWENTRVAVIGSGPSAKEFLRHREHVDPDHVILMNTVIDSDAFIAAANNSKLWLCALDPALFGRSGFGQEYRERMATVLAESDGTLVTAEHLARHVELNLASKVSNRAVVVRCVQAAQEDAAHNVDLLGHPWVIDTGNVLTTLALPLAATLAKNVFVFGCDGFTRKTGEAVMLHDAHFESRAHRAYAQSDVVAGVIKETSYLQSSDRLELSTAAIVKAFQKRGNTLVLGAPSTNRGFRGVSCIN